MTTNEIIIGVLFFIHNTAAVYFFKRGSLDWAINFWMVCFFLIAVYLKS